MQFVSTFPVGWLTNFVFRKELFAIRRCPSLIDTMSVSMYRALTLYFMDYVRELLVELTSRYIIMTFIWNIFYPQ